ncbi:MAG: DEAD-box ATP-dependent RNA helicase CshB [Candidatus Izimaplasma bacterium HR2]|nr:MAG: DEAD-box ATP-dependent RNA helicase CshB [Candidatus Izimaplasma bacterium HR2]
MEIKKNFIQKAIKDLGFRDFTEVQNLVIPKANKGLDIIGCSQTGTGKTHAFLIPIFEALDLDNHDVQAVITAPTRELAQQIYNFAVHIAKFSETHIDIRKYVGGSDREKEINRLKKSQPMIVIGTPGKIFDLAIKENLLNVYKAKTFVIDEADMSLEIGFLEDIDKLAASMDEGLQMMVFSATIPEKIRPFLRKYMNKPTEIFIKPKELSSLNIEHIFIPIKSKSREDVLLSLVKTINPYIALVFCNRKETVEEIGTLLYSNGYNVTKLHGDITPRQRKQVMDRIKKAEFQYIVASDIASRGIDIDGVSHVVNYELPKDMEFYIHRSGRTGRASYTGMAISLYTPKDESYLDFLENKGIDIIYKDIKNNELIKRRDRNERIKRIQSTKSIEIEKLNLKRKNKKVKPGYKKKFHRTVQKAQQKARRHHK